MNLDKLMNDILKSENCVDGFNLILWKWQFVISEKVGAYTQNVTLFNSQAGGK